MVFLATALFIILLPHDALAWGAGVHLQLGMSVLENLQAINPVAAAAIGKFPYDFLYGCIAADITVGKKFTHDLLHCHRWRNGFKVLDNSGSDARRACAYGYLSHLAADAVAHNYFVPYKIMRSFATITHNHAYWEMRFDNYVGREIWETARKVSLENYRANDELLRKVISDTIFSFGTNKRIFNSILLVSRLEKWQQVLQTINDSSRYVLEETDRDEYMLLARQAVFDFLADGEDSRFFRADPTGERALVAADTVRRNLRLLYRSGKLTKAQAFEQLEDIKGHLRDAICEPEIITRILPSST
jgi:zinc dependent phospholipase C